MRVMYYCSQKKQRAFTGKLTESIELGETRKYPTTT